MAAPGGSSDVGGAAAAFDPLSIHCWSGPRCVSTSLMYAWAQRSDTQVGAGQHAWTTGCCRVLAGRGVLRRSHAGGSC